MRTEGTLVTANEYRRREREFSRDARDTKCAERELFASDTFAHL